MKPSASERLDSWGEIAAYLRRAVRTVQRWEKAEGLPVHRHGHGKQSSVYAYPVELDAWWERHDGVVADAAPKTAREPSVNADIPTERRRASVLSATLTLDGRANAGPEERHRAVREGLELLSDAVHRFQGTVARFEDIGIVAAFGVPVALEDGVRRAVAAGMTIVRAARQAGLHARVGIDTGPVVAGTVGDWRHSELRLTGEAPWLAKALEHQAPADTVYVSESSFLAVQGHCDCERVGALVIEDARQPITGYRVVREGAWVSRFEIERNRGLTPLVGRGDELEALRRHLDQVSSRGGRLVVVTGRAGIGKSRLVLELRRGSDSNAHRWIEARCSPMDRETAFSVIVGLVRSALSLRESAAETEILERVRDTTRDWHRSSKAWLPYLRYLLNVDPEDTAIGEMDPAARRAGMLDAVDALFAETSRERPLVVIVEDVHWIDSQSQHALTKLIDRLGSLEVLVIMTRRPEGELPLSERSFVHQVSLESLSEEESREVAGFVSKEDLSEATGRALYEKTGGNPFFVEELLRGLIEAGSDVHEGLSELELPGSVEETIQRRIDHLDEAARRALSVGAVIGTQFPVRLVEQVTGSSSGLDRLVEHELVYESERFPVRAYSFKHALTRDVAYRSMLTDQKRRLHRDVAAAIEETYRDRLADHVETLASHYVAAEIWPSALDYARRAADKAAGAYAADESDHFFALALTACEKLGDAGLPSAVELASKRGWLLFNVARFPEASDAFDRMCELSVRAGEHENQWLALAYRGWAEWFDHRLETSEATFNEVLAGEGRRYPKVRFHAHMCLSLHLYASHRVEEALVHRQSAKELAEELERSENQAWWNLVGWHQLQWEGRFDETLEHLEKWRSVTARPDSLYFQAGDLCMTGMTLTAKGDFKSALALFERALSVGDRIGLSYFTTRALNCIGFIHSEIGDDEGAVKWNARGVVSAVNARFADPEVENNARINLADDFMALDLLDEAEKQYRIVEAFVRDPDPNAILDVWRYSQHLFHSLGELALLRGRDDEALSYADECLELAAPANHRKNVVKAKRLRGEVFLFRNELEKAEAELEQALTVARPLGNPPQLWKTLAAFGSLRRAQSLHDDAARYFAEAAELRRGVLEQMCDAPLAETFAP